MELGDGEPTNQHPAQKNLAGKSCGKILWENLVGKSCGKILQENLAEKSCGKILRENLAGNLVGNLAEKVFMVCNGSKNDKKPPT